MSVFGAFGDLGDAIEQELPYLRQQAESLHTLTLAAYSPNGFTMSPGGYKLPAFTFEGNLFGKIQGGSQAGKDGDTRYVTIGDTDHPVMTAGLHISIGAKVPVASEQRGVAWEYEVIGLGTMDDPALLGRRYMVVSTPAKSFATARRLDVIDITGG